MATNVEGINIEVAPFEDILSLKGIGPSRMEQLMRQVGRWSEYQEWLAPIVVDGVSVEKSEIRSYENLVSTWREFGVDPSSDKYAGSYRERTATARRDWRKMREAGQITDEQIARVIVGMKNQRGVEVRKEAEAVITKTAGVTLNDLKAITDKIEKKYEKLQRDYIATTSAAQARLLHVANLMVNLEIVDGAYTEINASVKDARDIDKFMITKQTYLSNESRRITAEINSVLKEFGRSDEVDQGPAKHITNTLKKGKEALDVFFVNIECPKCHTRYGVIGKFFPKDVVKFPVIGFECPVVHPNGKKCGGQVNADIDAHLSKQKVVKFTHQEHFDPSVVARDLLDRDAKPVEEEEPAL